MLDDNLSELRTIIYKLNKCATSLEKGGISTTRIFIIIYEIKNIPSLLSMWIIKSLIRIKEDMEGLK